MQVECFLDVLGEIVYVEKKLPFHTHFMRVPTLSYVIGIRLALRYSPSSLGY